MSKAEEYFKKEWGTGFIKAMLSEKNGLLEMSMEDIYNTMQSFADEQNEVEVDTILKLKAKLKEAEEGNEVYYNRGLRDAWLLADEQNKELRENFPMYFNGGFTIIVRENNIAERGKPLLLVHPDDLKNIKVNQQDNDR